MKDTTLISIAAMNKNRVIGNGKEIPWKVKEDKRHYRRCVEGEVLLVGRKTFEDSEAHIYGDKVLLMTRDESYRKKNENILVFNSVSDIVEHISNSNYNRVYNIGGGEIYSALLEYTDIIVLSLIEDDSTGDVFFPELDDKNWETFHTEQYEKFSVDYIKRLV